LKTQNILLFFLGICVLSVSIPISYFEIANTFAQQSSNYVVNEFELKGRTGPIAVNPNTNLVYVTNPSSATVSVFDGSTDSLLTVFKIGSVPYGIAINPITNSIYVAREFANMLSVVNGTTNTIEQNIEIIDPYDVAVNPIELMNFVHSRIQK